MEYNTPNPCEIKAFSREDVLAGVAVSAWSQAQRQACVLIFFGEAFLTEHFVPFPWNRRAKARAGLRELEKAGHLVRDDGRVLLIESSFARPQLMVPTKQLALPEPPGIGTALAELSRASGAQIEASPGSKGFEKSCPVQDRTGCPSQDGQSVPSRTGREPPDAASGVCAASCPGQARSSKGSINNFDRFDDRVRPGPDGDGGGGESSALVRRMGGTPEGARRESLTADLHRESALERLAKHPRLANLRMELVRRKTPTARRFWVLMEGQPYEAARLIAKAAETNNPGAYLNRVLQNGA